MDYLTHPCTGSPILEGEQRNVSDPIPPIQTHKARDRNPRLGFGN